MAKDKESNQYPVKLTLKQTWIAITVACGLFGSIFAAGVKVQNEINKVDDAIKECRYQEDVKKLKLSLGSDLAIAQEKLEFYSKQYHWYYKQLKACEKGGEYINSSDEKIPPLE